MTSQQTTTALSTGRDSTDADQLNRKLAQERATSEARTADRLARLRSQQAAARAQRQIRQQALRDKAADRLRKAKTAADVRGTAEARSLRVSRTRTLSLLVLLPVLCAFGIWSTAGVHAGVTAMTGTPEGSAMWWALWLLEPALITAVGWIILCRSWLSTSGGILGAQADKIMTGALGVSIVLNAIGHWPDTLSWQGVGGLVAHSLGPIGAATTAHLIGLIETAVTQARPTEGAPLLATLDTTEQREETASEPAPQQAAENALTVPPGATRLSLVRCSRPTPGKPVPTVTEAAPEPAPDTGRRSTSDQDGQRVSRAPAKPRADKGRRVPKSATPTAAKASARELSDSDLLEKLDAMITAGEVPESVSVRRAQSALGCGFDRAKRVLAMREERTETTVPGQLSVVDALTEEREAA